MILVVDVGNTSVSLGLYKNNELVDFSGFIYPKDISAMGIELVLKKIFPDTNIENCIISSVADELTGQVQQAILQTYHVHPLIINTDLNLGINIKAKNTENIGADRIANAYGASKIYDKRPLIVIDSGSATTFDIVDSDNNFIGGLIMPGLGLQLKSLSENTSKLPVLDLNLIDKVQTYINTDTKKAILSGVVFGHAQAIQGLITRCEKELKAKAFVVGTGGNAKLLSKYMKYKKFNVVNPTLTLDGIKMIFDLNID